MASSIHQELGWSANLSLGFQYIEGKTVLAHRERKGPLAVQRPFYPEGATCHVYLLHPPGGVVGGDSLTIKADIANKAEALITTPGATKFYRSAGTTAFQTQNLHVSDDGYLEWFPQENIFFPGAQVQMKTQVDLTVSSHLAMWEIQCFGRPSIGEVFDSGYVDSSLHILRNKKPLIFERMRFDAETKDRLSLMASMQVTATFVMNHVNESNMDLVRKVLPIEATNNFSASLIDDFLIVRYLGDSTDLARKVFIAIWSSLRQLSFGKASNHPRIWNT
ncbi:MAG: urease accessory protein UreD [Woeseiaceae bacterium]|nr:urease accessory protein UreD [Woeseiaceae bacterium]